MHFPWYCYGGVRKWIGLTDDISAVVVSLSYSCLLYDVCSALGWWPVSCDGNCNLLLALAEHTVTDHLRPVAPWVSGIPFNLNRHRSSPCSVIAYDILEIKGFVGFACLCWGSQGTDSERSLALVQCESKWSDWSLQLAVGWTGEGHMEVAPQGGRARNWLMKCKPVRCLFSCCQPAGNKWSSWGCTSLWVEPQMSMRGVYYNIFNAG